MNTLVTALMIAYAIRSYLIVYRFAVLLSKGGKGEYYSFRIRWYHKAASTYVLALPIYLIFIYFREVGA